MTSREICKFCKRPITAPCQKKADTEECYYYALPPEQRAGE